MKKLIRVLHLYRMKWGKNRDIKRKRKYIWGCASQNIQSMDLQPLSKNEYNEVQKVWGCLGLKPYTWYYQLFKTIDEFNPLYLSEDLYYPVIVRALNPQRYMYAFSHKGLFPIIYGCIKQPDIIVICNNGVFFNSNFEVVDTSEMIKLLQGSNNYIIKPTIDTSRGKGVRLVKNGCDEDVQNLLCEYGNNWIVQKAVEQSGLTAQFNPSSLNTFRFTTLFINGRASTQSIVLKAGGFGSIVDNLSAGGYFVGVRNSGQLREFGIDKKYCKSNKSASGVEWGSVKIEKVPEIADQMAFFHRRYMPSMGIVGWDVALDVNNQPIVIEANIINPGILFTQLANSTPIFGERTEEVVQYVVKKNM